jgi:hypothetical protein
MMSASNPELVIRSVGNPPDLITGCRMSASTVTPVR